MIYLVYIHFKDLVLSIQLESLSTVSEDEQNMTNSFIHLFNE
ncbi:hypothetical protein SXYLSMQ121_1921 [Staphylococcus xylosus]|nr:hypothetical protein SXYLSMQ121_1921 [Staphylococcus xylosus]